MQGYDYIFALLDKNNNFYQPDNSGMITLTSNPYFLKFSPDGWEDIAVQNIRNKKYWGIDRSVTVPLAYVNDGALILKDIYYKKGIEENVYLVICKQELDYTPGVSYGYWYKQIYKGEVDLSTFNHSGSKVTCTSLEDGLLKYLKANESTVYELPINVSDAINVKLDGINLHNIVNYGIPGIFDAGGGIVGFENFSAFEMIYLNQEGDGSGLTYVSSNIEQIGNTNTDAAYTISSDNFIIRNDSISQSFTFNISGLLKLSNVINNDTITGRSIASIYFMVSGGSRFYILQDALLNTGENYTYNFSFDITLNPGQSLFALRFFKADDDQNSGMSVVYDESSFAKITAITRFITTYIKAFRPQYIFTQLINRVTEGNYSAETASYFETWKDVVFTCGNAIRGLSDSVLKISLSDFFQFWDCRDAVGLSEKQLKVNFDSKENLIDKINFIDLGTVANLKVTVAKDYLFNELEIGYPEIKNDVGVLNGNEEFNCKYLFSVGTTKSPAKLDKVSKTKASCYEIEKIRVTTLAKETTDYKADNDNFVLAILPTGDEQLILTSTEIFEVFDSGSDSILLTSLAFGTGLLLGDRIKINGTGPYTVKMLIPGSGVMNVYLFETAPLMGSSTGILDVYRVQPAELDRTLNPGATGLIEPETVFNIPLSPKRNLLRNGAFIRSCMFRANTKILAYKSSDKNNKMVADGIVEKADVPISAMNAKFFEPDLFDFEVPAPNDLINLLDLNPLQVFQFSFDGNTFKGILVKVSIAPSTRKAQNYQLMSVPKNIITNMINYYG